MARSTTRSPAKSATVSIIVAKSSLRARRLSGHLVPHCVCAEPPHLAAPGGRQIVRISDCGRRWICGLTAPPRHAESTIVMRLPKEKILFVVDFLPVIKQVLAIDWDRMIPGAGGERGQAAKIREAAAESSLVAIIVEGDRPRLV